MAKGRDAGGYDGRDNLIPLNRRTKIEQKKIASMGGKASGAARRKRADLRRAINQILMMDIPDDVLKKQMTDLGLDPDMQTLLSSTMMKAALKGNVKAAEWVAKYGGQDKGTELDERAKEADIAAKEAAAEVRRQQAEMLKKQNEKVSETGVDLDDSQKAMADYFSRMSMMGGDDT